MERPKPGPAKRAPVSNNGEKSKRARVVLPRVLPKDDGQGVQKGTNNQSQLFGLLYS